MMPHSPKSVLDFWFDPANEALLFEKNDAFDKAIRDQFEDTWHAACQGLLYPWRSTIYGRLAEIIVLDQFSRNLMRDDARAFAQDPMAVVLSQEIIKHPDFRYLTPNEKAFALLPLEHSESAEIHEKLAEPLFKIYTDDYTYQYEVAHKEIIDRFGRYPHRNAILGRPSTQEEMDFLEQPGSHF
ncbi:DUF924 family protein [Fundicoccus sp. Sow4_F4]|uniref:DUF924 family protein n=1 Tax=Fundicoccus sp. Sow4_F4 TaxID=3438783 RepID=UPI003F91CD98